MWGTWNKDNRLLNNKLSPCRSQRCMHKTLHFPSSGPRLSKFQVQVHPSIWSSGRILQLSASWYTILTCNPIGTQQPNHLVDTCVSWRISWQLRILSPPSLFVLSQCNSKNRTRDWEAHRMSAEKLHVVSIPNQLRPGFLDNIVSTCSVLSVVVEILRQLQHTSSSSSLASNCPHFSISFASFSSDTAFSNVTFCYTCWSTCHCPSPEFRV